MDLDDLVPRKSTGQTLLHENLERFSIADLDERIEALESEIERCRAAKQSKLATLQAAQGFFKK